MTFQSLSALPLGPGASSVAKTQESGAVRSERTGQAGLDFSAFLNQAMQSKDWAGSGGLQRQGLADLATQALDRAGQDTADAATSAADAAALSQRQATDSQHTREDSLTANQAQTGTHQELTQRALRNASLRAAQNRAEGVSSGRAGNSDNRARKTLNRRDDDGHAPATAGNPLALPPSSHAHPVQEAADPHAQDASRVTATEAPSSSDSTEATSAQALNASAQLATQTSSLDAAGSATGSTPSSTAAGLTTLQLGPHMHIITPGQGVVNEQSLQAFAQSMGIDANQFKQLVTGTPAGSVDASGLRAGVTATDALTGTPLLPAAPTDMTAIDLSQVLPAGMPLEDLHIDWIGGRHGNNQDAGSPSTLDVLGMRDGGLGADAVASLQESADAGSQGHNPDQGAMGQSQLGTAARAAGASSAHAATAPTPQNMTEHFEKLSAKLATEMAGRIHEQFSQGEWKMKFALKPASLGQVDVQLEMRDGKLAAVLQADNPMTQDLLQNGSQRLRDALSQMGLSQSSVSVGDGRGQAFQGDRQPGAHGSAMASTQHPDGSDDSVQTVANAPRRDSLSQLDFYA